MSKEKSRKSENNGKILTFIVRVMSLRAQIEHSVPALR